ncbi:unnamed protein product, partial [Rotaria sp. Silwood1]
SDLAFRLQIVGIRQSKSNDFYRARITDEGNDVWMRK